MGRRIVRDVVEGGRETMMFVLIILIMGASVAMHDFDDRASCITAMNYILHQVGTDAGVRTFCVPKSAAAAHSN